MINQLQADTGADISIDDDGIQGTVTIGSPSSESVNEARKLIEQILNPPSAEVGEVYKGKVVTITKFGAFVNILPGRDGLVHISKLGAGKRVERVEDVLEVGQAIDVRVDEIDAAGKVVLAPVGPEFEKPDNGGSSSASEEQRSARESSVQRAPREERAPRENASASTSEGESAKPESSSDTVSFEDAWDEEASQEFGDLGPSGRPEGPGAGSRGPRRNRRK